MKGFRFGQQESLLNRLHTLLREYTEGIGILKELLQNADDARAQQFRVVVDWRTHHIQNLHAPEMAALLGPAILVYNDACFSEQDLSNIQSLGQSGKQLEIAKTGRFGLGFNSVYHVTDWPSFVSGEKILFLDPHCSIIPEANPSFPGHGWPLAEWWKQYPEFMALYQAGGLEKTENFQGTLFRLPLRTQAQAQQSSLRNTPFSAQNLQELLTAFAVSGEEMLLFLKSVESISLEEIPVDGSPKRTLSSVQTLNPQEVRGGRQALLSAVTGDWENLLNRCKQENLPWQSWQHRFKVKNMDADYTSTWQVINGMTVNNRLVQLMIDLHNYHEKAVPWVGAAACLDREIEGHVYCFLPLPLKTGHPVHLHGYFDLDASRHNLTTPGTHTGRDALRAQWNQELAAIVAKAWASLLQELKMPIPDHRFYSYWPVSDHLGSEVLSGVSRAVITSLWNQPIIASFAPSGWSSPQDIWLLPPDRQELEPPLASEEIAIPRFSLPETLINAFTRYHHPLMLLTPEKLKQLYCCNKSLGVPLEEAPRPSLQKLEWINNLLDFCLSQPAMSLKGLPFAYLKNEELEVFGYSSAGFIYLSQNSLLDELFAGCEDWFLANGQPHIRPEPNIGLYEMDISHVMARLKEILPKAEAASFPWKPEGGSLNNQWLTLFYQYLAQQPPIDWPTVFHHGLYLVPGSDGRLYRSLLPETPIDYRSTPTLAQPLKALGCILLEARENLNQIIFKFIDRHPNQTLIPIITAPILLKQLKNVTHWPQDEAIYLPILEFLNEKRWLDQYEEADWEMIQNLPIFPTVDGQWVSLKEPGLVFPGNYQPPSLNLSLKLIKKGAGQALAEKSDILPLRLSNFLQQFLLPEYHSLSKEQQQHALIWIRDNLESARTETADTQQDLRELVGQYPLVYDTHNQLRPITELYDPENPEIAQILAQVAHYPNQVVYQEGWPRWLEFFRNAGLHTQPRPDHIVTLVEWLSDEVAEKGVTPEVEQSCTNIFHYLIQNETLLGQNVTAYEDTLGNFLKESAWLPALRSTEELENYFLAKIPENRLYRPCDIYFSNNAHHVASQAPLLKVNQQPSAAIRELLGFNLPSFALIQAHFQEILEWWQTHHAVSPLMEKAIKDIYRVLSDRISSGGQPKVSKEIDFIHTFMAKNRSLWDEKTQNFWLPSHAFENPVPYFDKRRVHLQAFSYQLPLYRWAGMKSEPQLEDFLDFIQEIEWVYRGQPLPKAEQEQVLAVFKQINHLSPIEKNIPLLSEEGLLLPVEYLLIPDAEWWKDAIDRQIIRFLHPDVPHELATKMNCRSLLQDVKQEQYGFIPILEPRTEAHDYCQEWQQKIQSPEFAQAVQRLIWHHNPDMTHLLDLSWLQKFKLYPTHNIRINLHIDIKKKSHVIARDLRDIYFVDSQKHHIYLHHTHKASMRSFLTRALSHEISKKTLNIGEIHLNLLLDDNSSPEFFQEILNEQHIATPPPNMFNKKTSYFSDSEPEYLEPEPIPAHKDMIETIYPENAFGRTPARTIDQEKLREQHPDAIIKPFSEVSQTAAPKKPERERERISSAKAYLLASSFEDGLLWVSKAASIFDQEGIQENTYGIHIFDAPAPIRCQIDRRQSLLLPLDSDRAQMIDFFNDHGLAPGCELYIERMENGGYKLLYQFEPTSISKLPVISLDSENNPVVTFIEESMTFPCPVDKRLLFSQQRFADSEAKRALLVMAKQASDILQTIEMILANRSQPIALDDLYLLNFQICPVSYQYFKSNIERNIQSGGLFILEDGKIRLNPEKVTEIHAPLRQAQPPRQWAPNWPMLEQSLQQVLHSNGDNTDRLLQTILQTVSNWWENQTGYQAMAQENLQIAEDCQTTNREIWPDV